VSRADWDPKFRGDLESRNGDSQKIGKRLPAIAPHKPEPTVSKERIFISTRPLAFPAVTAAAVPVTPPSKLKN